MERVYVCIDLKSFYASVECKERGLDPLKTNLVVADSERTEKTICLAVSPSLKSYGISGRARLFEVVQKIREVNAQRRKNDKVYKFSGKSFDIDKLEKNSNLEVSYIIARPRMSYYIKYSTEIYNVYLKYLSCDDIYVYSIDEVFCDITDYLKLYKLSAYDLVSKMIRDVYETTGITATAGIGTNMFLAKVAMDIVAKHVDANEIGVRIAELDEDSYRKKLWDHKPLTSFWRVGRGYSKKLEEHGLYTMGDVARCSLENEELLYKLFGINAELLIDHAWGWEPCTIKDVKNFKPIRNCITSGQVLRCPYDYKKAKLVVREMTDLLSLSLVSKKLVTDQLVLTVGYDIENLNNSIIKEEYDGPVVFDCYGRSVPKEVHGTINLECKTSSSKILADNMDELFDRIINKKLFVKRINIVFNNLVDENSVKNKKRIVQFDLFSNFNDLDNQKKNDVINENSERKLQHVLIDIKDKYGKNAILKGMNLIDGATTIDRNSQIGGHRE